MNFKPWDKVKFWDDYIQVYYYGIVTKVVGDKVWAFFGLSFDKLDKDQTYMFKKDLVLVEQKIKTHLPDFL